MPDPTSDPRGRIVEQLIKWVDYEWSLREFSRLTVDEGRAIKEHADRIALQVFAALRGLPASEGQEWQPIETAPKDGTLVLLANANDVAWSLRCRRWQDDHWRGHDADDATHWAHLPEPPVEPPS